MDAISRQDFVTVTETAKNKIIERLVTKYDVQQAVDSMRDRILVNLQQLHAENQVLLRQSNAGRDQMWRRISAMETQLNALQQEIRTLHNMLQNREQPPVETGFTPQLHQF